jgi:hypothetical protein
VNRELDIEKLIGFRQQMYSFITDDSPQYYPGAEITLTDTGSPTRTFKYEPVKYNVATIMKIEINRIESHIAYMVAGINSMALTNILTKRYPRATHVLLVVCRKR